MSIQRKKMAFIKSIREQHLNSYFNLRRQELQQSATQEQMILSKVESLFAKLPTQIFALVEELDEHFKVVSQFLISQVKQFCNRMVGTSNVEWCNFVYVINRLLVSTNDKYHIQTIINESFLAVVEGAEMQFQTASNNIMQNKILKLVMQYCHRLGGFFKVMHQLQQNALISVMKRLWDFMWQQEEEEIALVQTSLRLFTTNFDEEDQQNITNMQRLDAENSKVKLIRQIFYEAPNEHRLQHIIRKMMALILSQASHEQSHLLNLYLRLLITFTKYTQALLYVYPLLTYNVLHVISTIIYTQSYQEHTIIYTLRLFNNLLMNDVKLTVRILQELSLSKVINLYHNKSYSQQIRLEIGQLLINLTHFLNDQHDIMRELIQIGSTEIVIESLQLFSKHNDDMLLQEGVSTLNVMVNIHPTYVKKIIRQYENMLTYIVEQNVCVSDLLQNILESCHSSLKPL